MPVDMNRQKSCFLLSLSITLCLAGCSLLLAFGVMFLKPYLTVRHLTRTMCYLTSHTEEHSFVPCSCISVGRDCVSYLPCVHIYVSVKLKNGKMASNVTLYDNIETYQHMQSTSRVSFAFKLITLS